MYQNYKVSAQLTADELDFLVQKWDIICQFYPINPSQKLQMAQQWLDAYQEKGRFYHNLSHIFNLIKLSEGLNLSQEWLYPFQLAIFYHDIVYNPVRKDNEAASAEIALSHWQKMLSDEDMSQLQTYILSTAQHQNLNGKAETQLFLDLDLSVLAAPLDLYQLYCEGVRREYILSFDNEIYTRGRLDFLKKYAQREAFFYSPQFEMLNSKARENINWEISFLQKNA